MKSKLTFSISTAIVNLKRERTNVICVKSSIIQVTFIHYLEFAQYLLSTTKFYNNICGRTNCVYYFNLNDLKHFAAGHSYSQVPGDLVTTS